MENLDDFMRKKFNTDSDAAGDRFEFREEYWKQAQALIEAAEARRRKRRRWLFWWLFAGFLVVGGCWLLAVGNWQRGGGSSGSSSSSGSGSGSSSSSSSSSGSGSSSGGKQTFTELSGGKPGDVAQQQGSDAASGIVSGGKAFPTDSVFAKTNTGDQGVEIIKGGKAGKNAAPEPTGTYGRDLRRPTSEGPSPDPSRNTGTKSDVPEGKSARQPGDQAGNDSPDNSSGIAVTQTAPTETSSGNRIDSTDAIVVSQNALKGFDTFAVLPTLSGLLDLPGRDLDTPSVSPFVRRIEPVRNRRFGFGLAAAGTLSQASPDGKRLGAVGGLFVQYKLTSSWSLTSGANWRFLAGDWADDSIPTTSEQLLYSFGFKKDSYEIETRGLHSIEIPLGLRWHHGAFAAEGGFAPGFLVGVQGRQAKHHSESLQDGISTEHSKVWLNKTPYYQFIPTVFLGGEWLATQQIGLTLRGAFRPGKIGDKLTDTPPPANLFWLDAGLRWYF